MAEAAARLLLFGQNSFIAGHLKEIFPEDRIVARSHGDLDVPALLDDIDVVINCARHPASSQDGFDLERLDPDVGLARKIGGRDIHMIMLSSRKVYAPSELPLLEEAPLGPADAYGRNKLKAEQRLAEMLGDRLTILRLANIFGDECVPGRHSFLALTLNRLAEQNQIRYDMSPFVERDFLPVTNLAKLLANIVGEPPGGIMNVGSGIALPTGRIALWILEGYGSGELLIASHQEKDRFVLDIARLQARFGQPCLLADLKTFCLGIGRRLRETHQR